MGKELGAAEGAMLGRAVNCYDKQKLGQGKYNSTQQKQTTATLTRRVGVPVRPNDGPRRGLSEGAPDGQLVSGRCKGWFNGVFAGPLVGAAVLIGTPCY